MEKSRVWAAAAIAAGLVFLGLMIPRAARINRSYERFVSVKGLCEREVMADKAIWPIQYKVAGNDLATVYAELEAKNALVKKFLKEGGVQDGEISVSTPTLSDKLAQEYGSNDRAFRYVAKEVMTVCSADVEKVLALMSRQGTLVRSGIAPENEYGSQPEFLFEGLNSLKPEMIEEATRNAREAAQKFAADSRSRLGKLRQAAQGSFSIEPRDSNTPYIKHVRVVTSVTYYLD